VHTLSKSLIAFILLLLSSLPAQAKLNVVCTLPDLAAIARAAGGDAVSVKSLISQNADPHYSDARPSLMVTLSKADVLCQNGLELEDAWLESVVLGSRNSKILMGGPGLFIASQFVPLKQVNAIIDRNRGDIHPGGNPHFLFDPQQGAKVGLAMAQLFAKLDPEHAAQYLKNAEALQKEIDAMVTEMKTKLNALPAARKVVVTYHRSLIYLLDRLGIEDLIQLEPKPGIPPNAKHLARVLKKMRQSGAKVVVQERYYPTNMASKLAALSKGKLVVIDGGAADTQSYVSVSRARMRAIIDAL